MINKLLLRQQLHLKYIIIITVLLLTSCNSYKRDNFDYTNGPNAWIQAYKDNVFYACLKEGYQNDTIFKLMARKDLFNPYDAIDFADIDTARTIGKKVISNMPKPWHCDDCKGTENYISANCLHYYASRELDSIAKEAYKVYIRRQKKLWGDDYK